ncbi:MAG: nucleoside permease [Planctomicrobium sp.]|nr:nucleoside permease [Planctomicrobium sp.]
MLRDYISKFSISQRLSAMMFLQFFIWGAWYVVGPLYLGSIGFDEVDFTWMYSVGPIACLISPFFVGMIADRFFPTEKVLGVMHLLAGLVMIYATTLMKAENPDPNMINIAFFVHMIFFFPTLALTNSLALHTMTDPESQFPVIRVFGTIGWVVVGVLISWLAWDASINVFYLAAGSGILLGVYSFTLPHTPPPLAGEKVSARELIGADAFVLLKHKPFLIFLVSSILICIPLAFYYQMAARAIGQAGIENVGGTMAYGQMSEIIFMLLMPLFFKRLGVKWMLLVGMFAWVLRYGLFALGSPVDAATGASDLQSMLILGIVLHGICYDFFFVTGQIYTDKVAPKEIRGQAQGMLALFTLGLGMLIGAFSAGQIEGIFTPEKSTKLHQEIKEIGAAASTIGEELDGKLADLTEEKRSAFKKQTKTLAAFQTIYRNSEEEVPGIETLNENYVAVANKTFDSDLMPLLQLQSEKSELAADVDAKAVKEQQLKKWFWIWIFPTIFAGAIMVGFFMFFNETEEIDAGDVDADETESPVDVSSASTDDSNGVSESASDSEKLDGSQ